jgi:hypothetical protein
MPVFGSLTRSPPLLTEITHVKYAHFLNGVFQPYFTVGVQTSHRANGYALLVVLSSFNFGSSRVQCGIARGEDTN